MSSSTLRKVSWFGVARVYNALALIFVTIWATRVLGPEKLGYFAVAAAAIEIIGRIGELGLYRYGSQMLAILDADYQKGKYLLDSTGLITCITLIQLTISLIFFFLILTALYIFDFGLLVELCIFVLSFRILLQPFAYSWIYVGRSEIKIIGFVESFVRTGVAVCVCIFVTGVDDLLEYAVITVLAVGAINFSYTWKMLHNQSGFRVAISEIVNKPKTIVNTLKNGIAFWFGDLWMCMGSNLDRIIVYNFVGPTETGLFEAAKRVILPFEIFDSIFTPVFFKRLSNAYLTKTYEKLLLPYFSLMYFATIPLGFFMLVNSKYVIQVLYGGAYSGCTVMLAILSWAITFGYISGSCVTLFSIWKGNKLWAIARIIEGSVGLSANLLLIPFLGGVGASIALPLSRMAGFVTVYRSFVAETGFSIVRIIGIFGAMSVSSGFVSYTALKYSDNGVVGVLSFLIVYLCMIIVYFKKVGYRNVSHWT